MYYIRAPLILLSILLTFQVAHTLVSETLLGQSGTNVIVVLFLRVVIILTAASCCYRNNLLLRYLSCVNSRCVFVSMLANSGRLGRYARGDKYALRGKKFSVVIR